MSTNVKSNQTNRHSVKADVSGTAFVEISSLCFWSDWATTEKHKIDLKEIIGFIIHWRGDSWHIEVKTKEKISEYEYRSYELSHCIYHKQIAELIANKDCKIIAFKNTHNSNNFIDHLNKVLKWADSL